MGETARQQATYADLMRVPEHLVAELIDGELLTHPRPAPRHALASSALGARVGARFHFDSNGPGGWWILDEPELHLGRHVLVPDLAGWRRERMPRLPDAAWFEQPPDWVCEVLSPSTMRIDRIKKMDIYATHSIAHCWLVDPELRTLEAFENRGGGWLRISAYEDNDRVAAPPFDAAQFDLSDLWDGCAAA